MFNLNCLPSNYFKKIVKFSENGIKNDYLMLKQMKNSLWMTSKFRTNENDINEKYHSKTQLRLLIQLK